MHAETKRWRIGDYLDKPAIHEAVVKVPLLNMWSLITIREKLLELKVHV